MADKIVAFGLLFMTVSANFTGNLFSCDIQRIFTHNIYAKHIVCLTILLLFVVLTNKDSYAKDKETGKLIVPKILLDTLLIYILFIITSKMEFIYTASIIFIIIAYMLLDVEKINKTPEDQKTIDDIKNVGMYVMILLGIVGLTSYFMKQYKDHSENFNYGTFLLGTNKCSGLK